MRKFWQLLWESLKKDLFHTGIGILLGIQIGAVLTALLFLLHKACR